MTNGERIVVGVSGASGAALGLDCLKTLKERGVTSSLVLSRGAALTIKQELSMSVSEFSHYATEVYDNQNIGASLASGTFPTSGMIIAPCSMKTLAGVAGGFSENLLLRAADVTIKERRPLVLMVRETPLSAIHLENMLKLSRIPNVVLLPPLLTMYNHPATIDQMIHHITSKALDVFHLECPGFNRWK